MNDQLVHSQKMEIVGQLAGGIAHDFNNILMVILNCCDFVLEDLTKDDPKFADIMQIHGACNRAISLTKQLLAFSRKQVLNPKILDIDELIQNLRMGLVRTLPASIKLELLTGASGNTIRVDPVRVEQVILNLVINAADAMSEGGRILIETSLENLDEHYAQSHLEALSGNYVLISVSDTGHGMNEDVKRKIFEPFFTTKAPGKGTGLGLSTVYGIVKQSGGSIFVYSELGKGTTFKIYFPVADEMPIETNGSNSIMKNTKGNATILLVEDEPGVRRVAARLLGLAGYTVLEATNGLEGLHFVDKHHDAIRLIVTDVVMPELSGFELCKAVQARYPRIKVIFMSGYNERSVQEQHTQWDPSFRLLQKPFTRESLLSAIETALAE
jgi:CheY-like chemotaxis protein